MTKRDPFLAQQVGLLRRRSGSGVTQLTGDATAGPGTGSQAITLANSGVSAGTYGDATNVAQVTVDAKGRVTAAVDVPISVSGSAGGGLVLLEQHTAAGSAQLDFTSWYSSAYDDYLIKIVGLIPATDAVSLLMTVSTDGGSSFSNTGYKYGLLAWGAHDDTLTRVRSEAGTAFPLGGTVENTASASYHNGAIGLCNPGSTTRIKGFEIKTNFTGSDAHYYTWGGQGTWASTSAINALRFAYDSGNIAEGTIRIYGIAKS